MEVASVLVEGGVLTHRFFGSQKLTLLLIESLKTTELTFVAS